MKRRFTIEKTGGKTRVALVLSGSGSDATAIILAWLAGRILGIEIVVVVSTNKKAGFYKREEIDFKGKFPMPVVALDYKDFRKECGLKGRKLVKAYSLYMDRVMDDYGVDMVFFVGNIVKIILRRPAFNIHPADKKKYGGRRYYGLVPHRHVLEDICIDIWREVKKLNDRQFTVITVHEVNAKFDSGPDLIRLDVEIPKKIIWAYYELCLKRMELLGKLEQNGGTVEVAIAISKLLKQMTEIVEEMQKEVLKSEHRVLPMAVELAKMRIEKNKEG